MLQNAFDFSKLVYKRYANIHKHYAFHHRCISYYILIHITNISLNDLQEAPENGKGMFYCHIKTDALVLASSLPGPKKIKVVKSSWN
jgi:hypothetical protein